MIHTAPVNELEKVNDIVKDHEFNGWEPAKFGNPLNISESFEGKNLVPTLINTVILCVGAAFQLTWLFWVLVVCSAVVSACHLIAMNQCRKLYANLPADSDNFKDSLVKALGESEHGRKLLFLAVAGMYRTAVMSSSMAGKTFIIVILCTIAYALFPATIVVAYLVFFVINSVLTAISVLWFQKAVFSKLKAQFAD